LHNYVVLYNDILILLYDIYILDGFILFLSLCIKGIGYLGLLWVEVDIETLLVTGNMNDLAIGEGNCAENGNLLVWDCIMFHKV
jgi:hypothetical protein